MSAKTRSLVERIVDLPTLPQVVTTLIELLNNPRSSVRDISTVLGNDPALVAKLLKIVNSSFYGLPNKVSNVPQAITILGYNTIKALAISASVFDLFAGGNADFPHADFWVHSLGTGTLARRLATALPRPAAGQGPRANPDTAFVAGLLNGIGKLILDQYAPDTFNAVIHAARVRKTTYLEAERETLADPYAEVGYWLTQKWQMPEDIQSGVHWHVDPASAPEAYRGLAAVVRLGMYYSRLHGYGNAGDFDETPEPPMAMATAIFRVDRREIDDLAPVMLDELRKADTFFALINEA